MKNDVPADIPATISLTPLGSYIPHPIGRANSYPSTVLHPLPLGIIGDFLNLLNRPLDRSLIPPPYASFSRLMLLRLSPTRSDFTPETSFYPWSCARCAPTRRARVRPPGNRLAPCYLFFKLFAYRPHPSHPIHVGDSGAEVATSSIVGIVEKTR